VPDSTASLFNLVEKVQLIQARMLIQARVEQLALIDQ